MSAVAGSWDDTYQVGPYSALGCAFRVNTDTPAIADYLRWLFRHLPPPTEDEVEHVYRLDRTGSIPALIREIDDDLIAHSPRLLLHAGGATHNGVGLALPARTGMGKSTLVAGLVRAGFGYLTDEFLSPDWDTGEVQPYPRAISLDPDVWEMLADLEPVVPDELAPLLAGQWQVDPEGIRPGSVAGPCRLGFVIFPRYEPGAVTQLQPMTRSDALITLIECTFHFHRHGVRTFGLLAEIIADCQCYKLTIGDLADACIAVCHLVSAEVPVAIR